jgi:hypothetical protein
MKGLKGPRGGYDCDVDESKLVLWLGLMCSHTRTRPEARPSMRQVCQCLDGEGEVDVQAAAMIVFADDDRITSTWGRWHP